MKKWKLFLLLLIISLLGITITFMVYQFYYIIDVRSLNISLEIIEGVNFGISGDTDKLDFGAISNYAYVEKAVLVENYREEPIKILVGVIGNVSPFIEVSENNFVLGGNASRKVELVARPRNAKPGHYSGFALFYFKRT